MVTWHETHCCKLCEAHPCEHGPHCEQKRAEKPPKRYDVRSLVLLGCSHEAADGAERFLSAMTEDVRSSMAITAERLGSLAVPAGPRRRRREG